MKAITGAIIHVFIFVAYTQAGDHNPGQTLASNDSSINSSAEKPCFSERQIAGLKKLLRKPYPGPGAWRCENTALATLGLNERVADGNTAILKVREELSFLCPIY